MRNLIVVLLSNMGVLVQSIFQGLREQTLMIFFLKWDDNPVSTWQTDYLFHISYGF